MMNEGSVQVQNSQLCNWEIKFVKFPQWEFGVNKLFINDLFCVMEHSFGNQLYLFNGMLFCNLLKVYGALPDTWVSFKRDCFLCV